MAEACCSLVLPLFLCFLLGAFPLTCGRVGECSHGPTGPQSGGAGDLRVRAVLQEKGVFAKAAVSGLSVLDPVC